MRGFEIGSRVSAWVNAVRPGLLTAALVLLTACATTQVAQLHAGMNEAEVVQRMGNLTNRYSLSGSATRLEFAKGPFGHETFMVDLDPAGRVTAWNQVLNSTYFAQVRKGMDRDAVLRLVGRPGVKRGEAEGREAWYWRFINYDCQQYAVTFDARGRAMEPATLVPDSACATPEV